MADQFTFSNDQAARLVLRLGWAARIRRFAQTHRRGSQSDVSPSEFRRAVARFPQLSTLLQHAGFTPETGHRFLFGGLPAK